MLAEKQNYEICEAIIEMFHEREISVEQSYAILDYVKRKIAQDTKVGEEKEAITKMEVTLTAIRITAMLLISWFALHKFSRQ